MRIPRSRGAVSGLALVVLGAIAALAPFVGPALHLTIGPNRTFDMTAGRFWLSLLPGVVVLLGGLITGVLCVVIFPWKLYTNPHVYIFTWLGFYGGVLGSVAGVLIAGYWVLQRTQLDLAGLSQPESRYWSDQNHRSAESDYCGTAKTTTAARPPASVKSAPSRPAPPFA